MCTTASFTLLKNNSARLVLFVVLLLLSCFSLQAREVTRSTGLRQNIFEQMQQVQALTENKELNKAQAKLRNMRESKLLDYELAQSWFLTGYIYYLQNDYQHALSAYEKVLKSTNIPAGMRQNVLSTLSQVSMVMEDYQRALRYTNDLLAIVEEPVPDYYILKAQVHYQLEQLDQSLSALNKAMQLQAQHAKKPKENWLLLKNAILYSKNNFRGMLVVLQQLVDLYPKHRYLLNMAAMYGELGNSKKQLALMEALYEQGSLTSSAQLVNLASLYLLHDIPYKGAVLLEQEISAQTVKPKKQHLEMLAQAWLMANEIERAIDPLQQTAKLADNGEAYVRLANTYMSLQRWQEAEKSLLAALKKGGLRDTGGTQLTLGMVHLNQKKYRAARRALAQAGKHPKTEQLSRQWLDYLAREEEKAAALENL
ncbi:MAG: tetratricopeptide repeat protein [Pseudomonadales bacterium]